jgi:hypothetical protein
VTSPVYPREFLRTPIDREHPTEVPLSETSPEANQFSVSYMRGYRPEWWVHNNHNRGNGLDGEYRSQEQALRHAALRNAGVRREVAASAVHSGREVIRTGDLVFVDAFGVSLIPAKVTKIERVPVPNTPNSAYTQIQVTVRLTASRPGYTRGEVLVKTGNSECASIVPRKSVRTMNGSLRISSGVFDV